MKLLHIINDEKFLDGVINSFKALDVSCRYIWLQSKSEEFRYIKNSDRVERVRIGSDEYVELLHSSEYDYIWIHYADFDKIRFVNDYSGKAMVIWSTWGADYISLINNNLFEVRTLWEWIKVHKFKCILSYFCKSILSYFRLERVLLPVVYRKFLSKVSYFSSVLPNEEVIIRRVLGRRPIYIRFQYADITRSNENDPIVLDSARNIWVGNSAHFNNNSFDVISRISRISDRDVYAPLSYGDSCYRKAFDQYCRKKLKGRWHPIYKFLPLDEYLKVMSSCGVFIFNHRRQQAIGNVNIALRSGGVVILNHNSPAWDYFTGCGLKVYSLQDLALGISVIEADFKKYKSSNISISRRLASVENRTKTLLGTLRYLSDSCKRARD